MVSWAGGILQWAKFYIVGTGYNKGTKNKHETANSFKVIMTSLDENKTERKKS